MNGYLRQSTAAQVRSIGPFVDDTDFKTLENGLTIANTDVVVSANGGADTTKNSGGATAHGAGGIYTLTWDATDTAAVGELFYSVKVAGALVVFGSYVVLEEAAYDAMYATSADPKADVNVGSIDANAITATAIASDAITAAKIADGAIDAATFAAGAITATVIATGAIDADAIADGAIDAGAIANGAIDAATFAADVDAEILSYLVDDATRIDASALNTATGTTIPDILTDTAEIGAAGVGLTNINLPNQTMDIVGNITGNLSGSVGSVTGAVGSVAAGGITATSIATDAIDADALAADALTEIQAAANSALVANHLDHLLAVEYDATAKPGDPEALLNALVEPDDGSPVIPRFTANALEQAPTGSGSGGDCPTAAEIADAVWDEDATGHQAQGSFGQAIGDPVADANTIYKAVVTDAAAATIGLDIVDVEGKVDDLESRLGTPSDLGSGATVAANLVDIEGQTDDIGVAGAGLTAINLPDQTMNIVGNITGNLSGSVGSVTGAVGSVAAGGITAASIATDAIDSDAIAASAVTELQSGLSTLDAAGVRTAVGLASANLDTQLDALPTATENADALLARDLGSGSNAGSLDERTVRSALRFNRNKFTIAGGVLTVYREDDATIAFTAAITQTAGNPVSASDPT